MTYYPVRMECRATVRSVKKMKDSMQKACYAMKRTVLRERANHLIKNEHRRKKQIFIHTKCG